MRGERYVVLGLAHVRSEWFRDVARWSTSSTLPLEFVKCLSIEELTARLQSGRPFSAVLVDGGLIGVDRDLVDAARESGCAVIVIDDGRAGRSWTDLGASAVLPVGFAPNALLDVLAATSTLIGRGDAVAAVEGVAATPGWRGRLIAVTGPGGTGASTVAMALAQGMGSDVRYEGRLLLADLALSADQAMLNDAGDVVPGLQELVEAHRTGRPVAQEIRSLTFAVPDRHYALLLGLRRHRDWATIRPRAFEAALDGLRRCYLAVVADVTGDLEGEAECGSVDVEDRNLLARTAVGSADVVVLVGQSGPAGIYRLVGLVAATIAHGVSTDRIVPVVNHAPRSPRARAEIIAALAELTAAVSPTGSPLAPPVLLSERRRLDDVLRDGVALPSQLVDPIQRAVAVTLERLEAAAGEAPGPGSQPELVPVAPGSLGAYYGADDE